MVRNSGLPSPAWPSPARTSGVRRLAKYSRSSLRKARCSSVYSRNIERVSIYRGGVRPANASGPRGAERAALRLEAFGSFPEAEEHLLDDFLGGVTVAEGSTGEGVGGSAVAAVDLRERVAVPPADGDDQGGVTHLGGHTGPHDVHSVAEGPRGSLRVEISRPGLVRYRAS